MESPLYKEQAKWLELSEICADILKGARNELYLSMRFLDVALNRLHLAMDMGISGVGTDGNFLYFEPQSLAASYRKSRVLVNRAYLHLLFHCLFGHLWNRGSRAREYWELACDVAAESLVDGLSLACIHVRPNVFRQSVYARLRELIPVLNAEGIYHALQKMNLSEEDYQKLVHEFWRDDHRFWEQENPKSLPNRNRKQDWDQIREKMQVEMEAFSQEEARDQKELLDQLAVENRERYDYKEFLKKFAVMKETLAVDPDAFDYIFYHYGMELYKNMPLIEPVETKELRRIEDFVIVIDTSMSCSGELVRRFLEETYSVLAQSESFFRKVNIHIIQCDDAVRQDVRIENEEQMRAYMKGLKLVGMGGTDFRPAFWHVEKMVKEQKFNRLRGLIYFTDGYGTFPVRMPPFDTVFVFMRNHFTDVDVPPWAMKVILDEEQLTGETAAGGEGEQP